MSLTWSYEFLKPESRDQAQEFREKGYIKKKKVVCEVALKLLALKWYADIV